MPDELTITSVSSSQAELDHAISPEYRDPAALDGTSTALENHEQRAERERKEAAEPGEPEYTRNVKKRIAKEVAKRKDLEERLRKYEPDYKPGTTQSNGNGSRPVERTAE